MNSRQIDPLVFTALSGIGDVQPGDDLVELTIIGVKNTHIDPQDGDIFIYAQKIVSKAEERYVNLEEVTPSREAQDLEVLTGKDPRLLEVILQESNRIVRTRENLVIVEHRLGFVCANAGIDHSNVAAPRGERGEWVLLLPQDPDASAEQLRSGLASRTGKKIGVLIIDSHGRAWRLGTVGVAIGIGGFPALLDRRGETDRYGRVLQVTQVGLADELAAGASVLMGQADEGLPIIHIRGFPHTLREGSMKELIRPKEEDLFR